MDLPQNGCAVICGLARRVTNATASTVMPPHRVTMIDLTNYGSFQTARLCHKFKTLIKAIGVIVDGVDTQNVVEICQIT